MVVLLDGIVNILFLLMIGAAFFCDKRTLLTSIFTFRISPNLIMHNF